MNLVKFVIKKIENINIIMNNNSSIRLWYLIDYKVIEI